MALATALVLAGCGPKQKLLEINYVSAPQVALRDQVAAVYTKVGLVKNGDRVEVLDRQRRFVKVRTSSGMEGWMEQRYLVSQRTYDLVEKLAEEHRNDPVQVAGTTRNDTNIHLEPARETNSKTKTGAPKPVMEDWWLVRDGQGRTGWILARMVDIDVPLEIAQY